MTENAQPTVLLHVRPDLGAFAVTGGERLPWLNGLVTQNVAKLAPGAGAYGLAVGKTGKIMAELWLVAAADRVLVITARAGLAALCEHFEKHLVMEDAEIGPPLDRGVLFVHGATTALLDEARVCGADAAKIDWTGRGNAAVVLAPEGALEVVIAALCTAAPGAVLLDDAGWEAQRIAWGVPRFGVDYTEQSLPQEASLEKLAVSFEKGCYLGQETVFMVEKRGHARNKLVHLAVEGEGELSAGVEIVLPAGGVVGALTSAARSPEGGWHALGPVKYKHAAAGTALVVAGRAARVVG